MRKFILTCMCAAIFAWAEVAAFGGDSMKGSSSSPLTVIFDTDLGNDVDDALAMDMLYKYMDAGEMDVIGVLTNKYTPYAPEMVDIMNTWYGYPKIPIGTISAGVVKDDYVNYAEKVCKLSDVYGKPMFKCSLKSYSKLLPSHVLYRKLLASQPDNSVVIISVGFSTNLARLLESGPDKYSDLSGKELAAKKVKLLSVMAGDFIEKPRAEFNVVNDIPSAQKVFAEWPTDIVISPFAVGKAIRFPAATILNDCNFGFPHPMVQAYLNYRPMPYDRQTWDLTSVLYVMKPEMFTISERGSVSVDDNGYTAFVPSPDGKHRILSVTPEQAEAIKEYFIKLISSRPARHR